MHLKNFEFKAKVESIQFFEQILQQYNPTYIGEDHQIDTYFNATSGRLKLREGNIENALIAYDRENLASSKSATIILYQHEPNPALKEILIQQLGIKVVVDKIRRIYSIDHIKFHFDQVKGLGEFIEVEAIDRDNFFTTEQLKSNCDYWQEKFSIKPYQMIDLSYSDLLLVKA